MDLITFLKDRKQCDTCVDCSDKVCSECTKVKGCTIEELEQAYDEVIKIVEKATRHNSNVPTETHIVGDYNFEIGV